MPELLEALEVKFRTGDAPELLTALETAGCTPSRTLLEKISKAGRDKCLGCNQMYAPKTLCAHLDRHPEHRIGTVAKEKKMQHELVADLITDHPQLAGVPLNLKAFRESGVLTEEELGNVDVRLDRQSYRRKRVEMDI